MPARRSRAGQGTGTRRSSCVVGVGLPCFAAVLAEWGEGGSRAFPCWTAGAGFGAEVLLLASVVALACVLLGLRRRPITLGAEEADEVRLGASTPRHVKPGQAFVARFAAYTPANADHVAALLEQLAPGAIHVADAKRCRWALGAQITVVCEGRGFTVADPIERFAWNGAFEVLTFDIVADPDGEATRTLGFDVLASEIRIARIRVEITVRGAPDEPEGPDRQRTGAVPIRTAFASYASEDRARVLDRIAALRRSAGVDCFVDCLSLHPGNPWKPRLEREIGDRESFLLFWSHHAARSKWVEWEWRTCLERKGEAALEVHPLDTVEQAPPPKELAHLHFDDPIMRVRRSYGRRGRRDGEPDSG